MRAHRRILWAALALASALMPARAAADGVAQIFDGQIKAIDSEVLTLAEAMPANKYDFAPTAGAFQGVRTFAEQTRHLATVIYMMSSTVLGEKPPVDIGKDDSGPASVRTKAQLIEYLRGALAFAHKAAGSMTEANQMDDVASPFGGGKTKRLAAISMIAWHTFDHYGQMVVYARMNGVIPPASLPAPPVAAQK